MVRHASDEELIATCLAPEGESSAGGVPLAKDPSTWARAHLDSGCSRCNRRFEQIRTMVAAFGAPPLREVPDALLARASAWLAEQERSRSAAPGAARARKATRLTRVWEEVRGTLVFDSAPGALLAGIRGGAPSGGRHLLYDSPWGSVHVRMEPGSGGEAVLRGQFLPTDESVALARARARLTAENRERTRPLSATGEFVFDRVPEAPLRLTLEWAGRRVVLEPLSFAGDADG